MGLIASWICGAALAQSAVELKMTDSAGDVRLQESVAYLRPGVLLERALPSGKRTAWEVKVTAGEAFFDTEGRPAALPITFELAELRYNRRREIKRRDPLSRSETQVFIESPATFTSEIRDHKDRLVETFEVDVMVKP
jgi:hypothetical protein